MPPKKAAKAAKGAPKKEAKADDPERLSRSVHGNTPKTVHTN